MLKWLSDNSYPIALTRVVLIVILCLISLVYQQYEAICSAIFILALMTIPLIDYAKSQNGKRIHPIPFFIFEHPYFSKEHSNLADYKILTKKSKIKFKNSSNKAIVVEINKNKFVLTDQFTLRHAETTPLDVIAFLLKMNSIPDIEELEYIEVNYQLFKVSDLNWYALKERSKQFK